MAAARREAEDDRPWSRGNDNADEYRSDAAYARASGKLPRWPHSWTDSKSRISAGLQKILLNQLTQFNSTAMYTVTAFVIGRLSGIEYHPPAADIVARAESVTREMLLEKLRAEFEPDATSAAISAEKAAERVTAIIDSVSVAANIVATAGTSNEEAATAAFARELQSRLGEANAIRAYTTLTSGVVPDNRMYMRACPDMDNIRRWFVMLEGDCEAWSGQLIIMIIAPEQYPDKPPYFYVLTENGLYDLLVNICVDIGSYHSEKYRPGLGIIGFMDAVCRALSKLDITNGIGINSRVGRATVQTMSNKSRTYNATHYPQVVKAVEQASVSTYENMFCAILRRSRKEEEEKQAAEQATARQTSLLGPKPARAKRT